MNIELRKAIEAPIWNVASLREVRANLVAFNSASKEADEYFRKIEDSLASDEPDRLEALRRFRPGLEYDYRQILIKDAVIGEVFIFREEGSFAWELDMLLYREWQGKGIAKLALAGFLEHSNVSRVEAIIQVDSPTAQRMTSVVSSCGFSGPVAAGESVIWFWEPN